ncbi:MAG: alpha-amylase family glycosyl hydrolase, partial [Egibacteraceae bacterium]
SLPKLDHRSPELRRRLFDPDDGVVARWVRAGLAGWRIDVANMTGRQGASDLTHEVARDMRAALRAADPEALLIAEHAFDASADLAGDGWHGTMDYAGFTRPVWSWLATAEQVDYLGSPLPLPRFGGGGLVATLTALRAALPWRSARHNLTLLGSHDTSRFRTVVGGDRARQRVGVALLMTLPGVPSVFAGDEIGLAGRDNEEARQPMPWDRRRWDHATLTAYRELIALRRAHVALRRGGLRWAHVGDDVVVFLREHPDERLLVAVARGAHEPVDLDARGVGAGRATALLDAEDLVAADGALRLGGDGPRVALWRLEG